MPDAALAQDASILQTKLASFVRSEEDDVALSHVPPISVCSACELVVQCHAVDVIAQHLSAEVQDGPGGERVGQDGCAQERLPAGPAQVSADWCAACWGQSL